MDRRPLRGKSAAAIALAAAAAQPLAFAPNPGGAVSESDQGQPKGRAAATFFIFITIVLDALAMGIVIPVMPQLIARVGHIRLDDTSTYVGIFGSSTMVMKMKKVAAARPFG